MNQTVHVVFGTVLVLVCVAFLAGTYSFMQKETFLDMMEQSTESELGRRLEDVQGTSAFRSYSETSVAPASSTPPPATAAATTTRFTPFFAPSPGQSYPNNSIHRKTREHCTAMVPVPAAFNMTANAYWCRVDSTQDAFGTPAVLWHGVWSPAQSHATPLFLPPALQGSKDNITSCFQPFKFVVCM